MAKHFSAKFQQLAVFSWINHSILGDGLIIYPLE